MPFLTALLSILLALAPNLAAHVGLISEAEAGSITLDLAAANVPAPMPDDPPVRGPAGRPIVVIDAGHGGRDPGSSTPSGGTPEKEVTLALARAIRDELLASGRVRVALTRDEDLFIPLRERYEIARRLGASLFVSVHADAAPNDAARGATIYTLSEVASDREAALLAARENQADLVGGARLSKDAGINMILIDLAQRESMNMSADFARLLRREASAFVPFRPEYHRFASLLVLKAPDIPSILFESGYLTNIEDAAYLQSDEGKKQIATGMRRAIEAHFARQIASTRLR